MEEAGGSNPPEPISLRELSTGSLARNFAVVGRDRGVAVSQSVSLRPPIRDCCGCHIDEEDLQCAAQKSGVTHERGRSRRSVRARQDFPSHAIPTPHRGTRVFLPESAGSNDGRTVVENTPDEARESTLSLTPAVSRRLPADRCWRTGRNAYINRCLDE